jgi:hypothetical protein
MHDIEMHEASDEFARCWRAAGQHIQRQVQGSMQSWLKASLNPPFLEHMSFRLGNQLFFVRIQEVEGRLAVPGTQAGLLMIARECKGHACIMPMQEKAGTWTPEVPGWGLLDAHTGQAIDPVTLISDEKIEMTDWEVQDFAVQIVRDHLRQSGRELMSWQGNPGVDPSLWFVGNSGPEWVVVRAARYPTLKAKRPANWEKIAEGCARIGKVGHFASVSIANHDDAFDPSGTVPPTPFWRGHRISRDLRDLSRDRLEIVSIQGTRAPGLDRESTTGLHTTHRGTEVSPGSPGSPGTPGT